MCLLRDAGYIEARINESTSGNMLINLAAAQRLTNSGHDLLDLIRNDTLWVKVKAKIASKGLDITFDSIGIAANQIMKTMFT
jgi:hypothetical protein